ncbi:MAG: hypothetical protein ACRC33_31325 [Gemmataceae bacterium]
MPAFIRILLVAMVVLALTGPALPADLPRAAADEAEADETLTAQASGRAERRHTRRTPPPSDRPSTPARPSGAPAATDAAPRRLHLLLCVWRN